MEDINLEDRKLLAFFAANAHEEDLQMHQEYYYPDKSLGLPPAHYCWLGVSKYTREELKLRYAKVMLDKFKEFCDL